MNTKEPARSPLAFKWLSYLLLAAVAYYWILSAGLIIFRKPIRTATPRQTALYYTFFKQDWGLFARTKVYNRKLNFITRSRLDHTKTDTIDLVAWVIAEKRAHAPFNNYYDAMDVTLYRLMNKLEVQLAAKQKLLKNRHPAETDSFYVRESFALLLQDSLRQNALDNLTGFGKHYLKNFHKDTANREYQLILVHKFIAPQKPPPGLSASGDEQVLFMSNFKAF